MGEKVVRRKHLKTANQGVDGRFPGLFLLLLLLFFSQTVTTVWEMLSKKQ